MAKKEVNNKDVKKNDKNKKTFFKSFKTELKKVVWPTPKQLVNNTVTVVTIVLVCAVIVFVLDMLFETVNKQGIERIRDAVVVEESPAPENTTTEDSNNSTEVQVNNDEEENSQEEANTTNTESTDNEAAETPAE